MSFQMPQRLEVVAGEDRSIPFSSPEVMTGWALKFAVSLTLGGVPVITKTTASGVSVAAGGLSGTVTLLRADTLNLAPGQYWFALHRTDPGDHHQRAYGVLEILPTVQ